LEKRASGKAEKEEKDTGPRQGGLTGTWGIYPSGSAGCIRARETATGREISSQYWGNVLSFKSSFDTCR